MRTRKCPAAVTEVIVSAPASWISDIPALLPSTRKRNLDQSSSFIERLVYKKAPGSRVRGRRKGSSRGESSHNSSFSDVEDEITEMRIKSEAGGGCIGPGVGVHIPRDNILEEENSLPLTKLEYKLESEELSKQTALDKSVSSNPVKVSISRRQKLTSSKQTTSAQDLVDVCVGKVQPSPESGKVGSRRANLRPRNVDLSELPLSHVKNIRQKIKKSSGLKKEKLKHLLRKKLSGGLNLASSRDKLRSRLRFRERPSQPPPHGLASTQEISSLSVTVFDADVARPSRPIHRPVRYLDSLNQNADNIAIKKLNLVDKLDLPYDKEALSWNKSHSRNKENVYCYCGGPGSWHEKMVRCVRCSQWFHERCLAPRPYTMPIIPGDTAWLFVCSLCNSGSECLKRMDMGWTDLVHLALYDLTLKTSRKFHDFEGDLMPHLLTNWSRFQLYKHFNVLTEEVKTSNTMDCLVKSKDRFERGPESKQSSTLWGLRTVSPPPRPVYKVPDIGIISERTVLDEYSLPTTVRHEKNEKFTSNQINKIYKDYVETEKSDPRDFRNEKSRKFGITKITSNASHTISDPKLLKVAKVEFRPLKLPQEILNDRCRNVTENKKLPPCKRPAPKSSRTKKKPSSARGKPLPFEIARDLHKKGYPKVAMKFATIVPPKRDVVQQALKEETCTEQKTKKKKTKKEKEPPREPPAEPIVKNVLESLIPEKPNFLGENNPFQLGSVEEQRKARQMICNRKLKEEDLTRWRSRIKKRTYKLDIEQARKVWRKECAVEEKNCKTIKKHHSSPSSADKRRSLLCAGTFTAPGGKKKIILSDCEKVESQVEL